MKTILKAGLTIDGISDSPLKNQAIVIENSTISKICHQNELTDEDTENSDLIENPDGVIMPGFIEMHSHIHCSAETNAYHHATTESNEILLTRGTKAVRDALLSGVTTMRDLGSKNEVVFPLRESIRSGIIPGPRLLVAGTPITTTGGHCNMFGSEADTEEEVTKAVRQQFKLGADHIKIISTGGGFTPGTNVRAPQYSSQILKTAVEDSERLGLKVSAHCHATQGVINCVNAGVHNLIHCSWLSQDSRAIYDYRPDVAKQISDMGIYVDPTLALSHLNKMRGRVITPGTGSISDPVRRFEILRDMWDKGVKFVTGMDSGMTNARFGDFAYIPEIMVNEMGISPMEAIFCSTRISAECLGLEDKFGTLEVEKSADILILKNNPLTKISALHNVDTVIAQGKLVKRNGESLI